jgi:hypothetical protein
MRPIPSSLTPSVRHQVMMFEDTMNGTLAGGCPIPFAILVLNRVCPDPGKP